MANTKISALTALTGADLANDDAFAIVDTSATATKKITVAELKLGIMPAPGPIGATTPSTAAFTTMSATTGAAVGGATAGTGGLAFPATAVAVADANTLDDYEEGTWTPTQGAGLTVVGAFSSVGTYTKIGRKVTVTAQVSGAISVSKAAGTILCGGLPFTPSVPGNGSANDSNVTASGAAATSSTTIYSTAFSATTAIYCVVTYFI